MGSLLGQALCLHTPPAACWQCRKQQETCIKYCCLVPASSLARILSPPSSPVLNLQSDLGEVGGVFRGASSGSRCGGVVLPSQVEPAAEPTAGECW